jgi:hypothetical protein
MDSRVQQAFAMLAMAGKPTVQHTIIEGVIGAESLEDGGAALITQVVQDKEPDSGMFVRLQSWNAEAMKRALPTKEDMHPELSALIGKRVRVTIEVLP